MSTTATTHKPIHAQVWSPLDKSLFKFSANDPATCKVFYCERSETCEILKRGQCINNAIFASKCPHGYVSQESGPTKRARSCSSWVAKKREEFRPYFGKLAGSPPDKMVVVGDWLFLPYSHLDMNKNLPILGHSALFISGRPFLKKEEFTISVIKCVVDFHPYALMGGEIESYQKEVVPKFLAHLEEVFVELYKQLLVENPHYVERYNLVAKNYIGRMALLKTINPSQVDIGKHTFQWNGMSLTSLKFDPLWIDVQDQNRTKAIDQINVLIVPSDKAVIKIVSNDQVSAKTVFVD